MDFALPIQKPFDCVPCMVANGAAERMPYTQRKGPKPRLLYTIEEEEEYSSSCASCGRCISEDTGSGSP